MAVSWWSLVCLPVVTAAARTCIIAPGEACATLWASFGQAAGGSTAGTVVALTFDGDGYFHGAQAAINSAMARSQASLLFAVASATHAAAIAEWFGGLGGRAERHSLCAVDPKGLPEVWSRAEALAGYSRPRHHEGWAFVSAALYRVFLRELFPLARQVVYLDADVVVQADVSMVAAELSQPMALPISAARSANTLRMRMDFCCGASKKARQLLANTSLLADAASEGELLQEFQDLAATYREFNNGVMALDLLVLEKEGVFSRLHRWLQLNVQHGLFNNDQHAWNLAASKHWQDLQGAFETNAPSLDMLEASLREQNPAGYLRDRLRSLAFVHYTNQPKPWEVDWSVLPAGTLADDGIWLEAFQAGGHSALARGAAASVREVAGDAAAGRKPVRLLRPQVGSEEHLEYGLLYMEGSGGMGRDVEEARWRFRTAAEAGDKQAAFMLDRGLDAEVGLSDKQRLEKLMQCWHFAARRVRGNDDHQTLRMLYQLSEQDYLARKAPAMVAACYWRLDAQDLGRARSDEELPALFSTTADGLSTPAFPPRLAKWLELVAKDEANAVGSGEAPGKKLPDPPLRVGQLLLVVVVVAGLALVPRLLRRDASPKEKKRRKKQS